MNVAHRQYQLEFLEHLCQKCGCDPSAWARKDAVISVFETESFGEPDR